MLESAKAHLRSLESSPSQTPQMSLFNAAVSEAKQVSPPADGLRERLAEVNPEELTPRQALDLLFELQALLESE